MTTLNFGARFIVPPISEGASLFVFGCLPGPDEERITRYLELTLRCGDVFVDIGANVGFYSLLAASLCGPSGRVVAIEPQSNLAENIRASSMLNNWQERLWVESVALAERKIDHIELFMPGEENVSGSASFHSYPELRSTSSRSVTARPGDELLKTLDKVSVIKIDVEGYELNVLTGLFETISRKRPRAIIVELFLPYLNRSEEAEKIIQLLATAGYEAHEIDQCGSLRPIVYVGDIIVRGTISNLVFVSSS